MKSQIKFADEKLKLALKKLRTSTTEDSKLYDWINRALNDIEENAFCAIQIPKRLIPKEYIQKYEIDNLWKYDLPDGWRLIYSIVTPNKVEILAVIMEWFDHKNYERRFKY